MLWLPLTLSLAACHVFASAALETTCEDDGDCVSADTGGGEGDDTGALPQALSGTVHYTWIDGDQTTCDATIALVGTPYEGTCEGCDFAFSVQATITQDDGDPACNYIPQLTLLEQDYGDSTIQDFALAFAPEYTTPAGVFTDTFMVGYMLSDPSTGEPAGPYWWPLAADDVPYGGFSQSGADLSWSWVYDYTTQAGAGYAYLNQCDEVPQTIGDGTAAYGGSTVEFDQLPSGAYAGGGGGYGASEVMDLWSIRTAEGDTVSVTVDTTDAHTAFDPAFYLTDEDTCVIGMADDSFDCTYEPLSYQCPSARFEADGATYTIAVLSLGSALGAWAEYALIIDAAADPVLTLEHDDVANEPVDEHTVDHQIQVEGSGTITGRSP